MSTQDTADLIFLFLLVAGIILVFPWMASTLARAWSRGASPVFGAGAAKVGAFLLAVTVGMAAVQFVGRR